MQGGDRTLTARRELLRAHRQQVERPGAELAESLEVIDSKIRFYGQWIEKGKRPRV